MRSGIMVFMLEVVGGALQQQQATAHSTAHFKFAHLSFTYPDPPPTEFPPPDQPALELDGDGDRE